MPAQERGTIFVKVTFDFSILFRPTRNAGVFRAGENGERSQDVCRRLTAQTSGVKNIVSTIFFTLSQHAARKSGTRGEIREGVFSDGITGCLGRLAAQTSGVKNIVSAIFFTLPVADGLPRSSGSKDLLIPRFCCPQSLLL